MTKLIIWDIDGVFWKGSITEGGDTTIDSEILNFIKNTEKSGIVHSLCSNNTLLAVTKKLEEYNIWDLFVFPSLNFKPKGQRVQEIISNCQLREDDVVYVDDNIFNLNEVKFYCPKITTYNDPIELINSIAIPNGESRTKQYKILETKHLEKQNYYNNYDFLKDSNINIAIAEDLECVEYYDRIEELVNRSNQLNYTRTRFDPSAHTNYDTYRNGFTIIQSPANEYIVRNTIKSFAVFVWDKYGYYGLVGYISVYTRYHFENYTIKNFVFSCRVMNMNIESFCFKLIKQKFLKLVNIDSRIDETIDTDYIKLHPYKDVENFIRKQENIVEKNTESAILLANCLGPVFKTYSKHNHNIKSEVWYKDDLFRTDKLYHNLISIDNFPKLIIFMGFTEFIFNHDEYWNLEDDKTQEYFNNVINNFIKKVQESDKKLLVFIPALSAKFSQDIKYQFLYNAWIAHNNRNSVTIIHIPEETDLNDSHVINATGLSDVLGIRNYSRKSMNNMAKEIDIWLDNLLKIQSY